MAKSKRKKKSTAPTQKLVKVITAPKMRNPFAKIGDVTPQQFKTAMRNALGGHPSNLYNIMDRFRRIDGHLGGDLQRRIAAATTDKPGLIAVEENDAAAFAREAVEHVLKELKYRLLSGSLLQANYYGVRAIELVWGAIQYEGKMLFVPVDYNVLPNDFIHAKKINKDDKYTSLYVGKEPLVKYPAGKILLLTHEDFPAYSDINFVSQGVGLAAMRYSIYKYFDFEDWAAFNEVYGMPMRIGKYESGASEKDIKVLENGVHDMGSDASAVISEDTSIEFPEVNRSSSVEAFDKFKDACNREISDAILSQSITSSTGQHGTYGTAVTANGISIDVAANDAYRLDLVMQELVDVIVDYNFTNVGQLVFFTPVKKADNLNNEVTVSKTLQEMGLDQSKSHLRKKYNAPEPKDEDDTLPGKQPGNLIDIG